MELVTIRQTLPIKESFSGVFGDPLFPMKTQELASYNPGYRFLHDLEPDTPMSVCLLARSIALPCRILLVGLSGCRLLGCGLLLVLSLCGPSWSQEGLGDLEKIDFFENRVRPVLVDNCLACHSLASRKSSGGLLLDSREGWQAGGDSGQAIAPGKPDQSLLIQAIRHADGVSPMPPAESGLGLSESQIRDLETWVLQGAYDPREALTRIGGMSAKEAQNWWAFEPLNQVQVPEVVHQDWVWNPVDRFVVATLESKGLEPLSIASKRAWHRRVTIDLTGLVPTPEQTRQYLEDPSQDAEARLVDRLLNSPEHAERYGRHWLDVARYADTAGDGADYPVPEAYKYRDWVIRSIHQNKPWDQFLREQIAGDLYAKDMIQGELGKPDTKIAQQYADLVTATGFLAIGKRYGYAPNSDFQHLDFADVIDSLGRSVLGLSIGCARCHDHKYDPISMEDYYGLYGILQSTLWAFPGGEEHKRPANFPPLVPPAQVRELEEQKQMRLRVLDESIQLAQSQRMQCDPNYHAGGVDLDLEAQELGPPPAKAWLSAGPNRVTQEAQSPYEHVFGAGKQGVRIGSGTPYEGVRYVFGQKRNLADRAMYFSIDFRVPKAVHGADQNDGSCRLYLGQGVIESIAIECSISRDEFAIKDRGQWKVIAKLQADQWYHLQIKLDPSDFTWTGGIYGLQYHGEIPKTALPADWDRVADTFICDGFGHVNTGVIARDLDNLGLDSEPFAPFGSESMRRLAKEGSQDLMASYDKQIQDLQVQRAQIASEVLYPVAYGVSEAKPVDAAIQLRGEPSKTSDQVPRRYLSILGGQQVPAEATESGRRELARWLTDPKSPLAARVFVNRLWHWHFGRGLVPTTSDFGMRGQGPSHPELLDYLAKAFIESGWDVRQMHRWMVLSRTYRLSSQSQDSQDKLRVQQGVEKDPENQFLWRYTKRPMDAETIRDSMLSLSGLLDPGIPHSHPFPPTPTWAFTIHNPFHAVYESKHRSVYLMQQRNRKHPYLSLFDGADPNLSIDQRKPTTTPTQTLYLMNSPMVHQASESLARKLIASTQDTQVRLSDLFQIVLSRPPSDQEQQECLEFIRVYSQRLASESPGTLADQVQWQSWGALSRVLMTSNSFLYID